MTDALIVFCTCSSREEGLKLAEPMVREGAATCVNIVAGIESVYRWQGKIETAQEVLLLIKTTREQFAALRDLIVKLHSYDTPEVIAVPVTDGLAKYLRWLGATIAT
jgi:periplasmic divalent cation tolerance protein